MALLKCFLCWGKIKTCQVANYFKPIPTFYKWTENITLILFYSVKIRHVPFVVDPGYSALGQKIEWDLMMALLSLA